jgi:undecaprenyl diphosphate synthase
MERETAHCKGGLTMNICLSYGSRGEIIKACQSIATEVRNGTLQVNQIDDDAMASRLLTTHSPDPDIVIRTSGEYRLSNFLLWQLAYAEMFFLSKTWPELEKEDLIEVIRDYAGGRNRRYGQ